MSVPSEIFKAYDVRGLYGDQIDGDTAEAVGRAFVRVLSELGGRPASDLRVGLGRDMRLTAPELAARYREGMTSEGSCAPPRTIPRRTPGRSSSSGARSR
jgi:phosphomannomutase